jgi:hypothetical protein
MRRPLHSDSIREELVKLGKRASRVTAATEPDGAQLTQPKRIGIVGAVIHSWSAISSGNSPTAQAGSPDQGGVDGSLLEAGIGLIAALPGSNGPGAAEGASLGVSQCV